MNEDLVQKIEKIAQDQDLLQISESTDFYFQKGQDALNKWLQHSVTPELEKKLIELSKDYDAIKNEAKLNRDVKVILDLLFEIISYCDEKANEKNLYNKYEDKRTLARASVRMYSWVEHLILFKFSPDSVGNGSTKNAFNFLLDPENNATILSENHRELISKNLFGKPFISNEFVSNLKLFFLKNSFQVKNKKNYTELLSFLIYKIQDEWKEEVVALMASDSTGWQDKFIKDTEGAETCIVWNSKRPSGTDETLKFLRNIVETENKFNIYYTSGKLVNYKATIIDFVENQNELDEKQWNKKQNVKYYEKEFASYADKNKSAKIVFLAKSLEKIKPIPISSFEFYNGYEAPRQDNLSPIKKEPDEAVITIEPPPEKESKMKNVNPSLNQILYGPPGTGKTYHTVNKAIAIANPSFDLNKPRQEIKKEFDRLMQVGQIVFTTFHQSMTYEDFIEGIKPIEPEKEGDPVIYRVELGVFQNLCIEASFAIAQLRDSKTTEEVLDFSILYDNFVEEVEEKILSGQKVQLETKTGGSVMVESISQQGNFVIKHHDGTRTYTVSKARLTKLQSAIKKLDDISNINDQFREIIGGSNSSAYWSVLNAIRKEKPTRTINKVSRNYTFEEKKEVVVSLANTDYKNKEGKPYVFIIDEINRGNVSQIFGELITLIEEDKRLGKEEALEVTLPYSKEKFGVPPNLYIIGTMNTADRSVEALDTALRRRFSFEEKQPDAYLIASEGKLKEKNGVLGDIDLPLLLNTINKRIEKLLDKDHQIGHSYFLSVGSLKELKGVFQNKIIPLLQEYFFGDYGKIGLVLGEGFFAESEKKNNVEFFPRFFDYDGNEFSERTIYKLKDISHMVDEEFKQTINLLLQK